MKARMIALATVLSLCACLPLGTTAQSPTPASPTASPTAQRIATPTPTLAASPSPSPLPSSSAAPTALPGSACGRATGGNPPLNGGALLEVRFGSQPGAERIVFDFGAGPLPNYTVEPASSFLAPSGQTVPVQGNTHVAIRLNGAGGMGSYRGPTSFRPASTLIREVKLVEDFEGVLVWGVGLERVSCPRILVLSSPTRLVLDFP